jgi:glycine/D-amino acid oxidase-like deaminating enzyme
LEVEELDDREMMRRWPGFKVPEGLVGAYERRAGYLHVERCVQAHAAEAVAAGAELISGRSVVGWRSDSTGITVSTDREEIGADRLVIAAGPWAPDMLGDFAVQLQVLRKPVFWLATRDDSYRPESGCPCYLYELPHGIFYGVPQVDGRGVKVAEHSSGEVVRDPLSIDRSLRADDRDRVMRFAAECLPGAGDEVRDHSVCMYTMTADRHFIIDHHPSFPQVIVVAGLSGHGFKFVPVLGEVAADLAIDGTTNLPIDFLRMSRFHGV